MCFRKCGWTYSRDASIVNTSTFFREMAAGITKQTNRQYKFNFFFFCISAMCINYVGPEFERFVQYLVCRIKLHRHAQSAVHHVIVAVLGAKRLVGDLEARRAIYCSINPRHLRNRERQLFNTSITSTWQQLLYLKVKYLFTSISMCSSGMLTKVGRRLLNHMAMSLFMLTAKGSKPSWRPYMV